MLPRTYEQVRRRTVGASPQQVWRAVEGIGGERGWGPTGPVWALRGQLDRLVGGAGQRRGRRDPDRLDAGDPLDTWRVLRVSPGRLLRLRSEMRLPGVAELELEVGSLRRQLARRQEKVREMRGRLNDQRR